MDTSQTAGIQTRYPTALASAACGIGVIIGSFGPWVKATLPFVGTITISGTDGQNDGIFTMIIGGIAAALMLVVAFGSEEKRNLNALSIVAGLGFLVIAFIAIRDWMNIQNAIENIDSEFRHLVSAGWGLYLTGFAGLAGGLYRPYVPGSQIRDRSRG